MKNCYENARLQWEKQVTTVGKVLGFLRSFKPGSFIEISWKFLGFKPAKKHFPKIMFFFLDEP